jgi:hypothetical protein
MIIDKFTIQTQDSIAIARDKLTLQIHDNHSLLEIRLVGKVSENNFRLYRVRERKGIPMTIINGWFEDTISGTVVHLELEVKSIVIIVYLLFVLFFSVDIWQHKINYAGKDISIYIGMMVVAIAGHMYSFQAEKMFCRKKFPQIFS